jgi:hypothetical protein
VPSNWVWAFYGRERGVRGVAVLVLVATHRCRCCRYLLLSSSLSAVVVLSVPIRRCVVMVASLIYKFVSWVDEGEMTENRPRQVSWPVFMTHYTGLPLHGSPLVFLHPKILRRASWSRPHPSGKGRGGCSGSGFLSGLWRLDLGPHPSREGRGSFPCVRVWLAANRGGDGEGGGGRMGGGRTNINRDGVDLRLKLRSSI